MVKRYNPNAVYDLISTAMGGGVGGDVSTSYVCVGDTIDTSNQEGFLRGHGTQLVDDKLVATVCGTVERVNLLVYVKPLKTRYAPQMGDVVVGRITEVMGKRWKVDLNARLSATLELSAVNLPGGIQRRRTQEDELNMRSVFREGDLVSAEVQAIQGDRGVALHTRSAKYGKLGGGQLVCVPPYLVKRQKQHFHSLTEIGVDIIFGLNGSIWVAPEGQRGTEAGGQEADKISTTEGASRAAVCRVANAVRALAKLYLLIHPTSIMEVYEMTEANRIPLSHMTDEDVLALVVANEAHRRTEAEDQEMMVG